MRPLDGLGLFDIVLADPPWRSDFGKTCSRATERHYETMTLEEISLLPVPAKDDALLFLWTTAPMLEKSLQVVAAWGFSYRTSAVWVKDRQGTGKWFRNQHEILLLARRGRFRAPDPSLLPASVVFAPRGRHSQKPEGVQDMIERVYPDARRLEMFARRRRPGWECWGDDPALEAA